MTKTEQILKQVKRAVDEANKKGIQLSKRQQQIYKNIFESSEQRGKYATAKYLLQNLPKSKTETAQRNLQETVTRLKRKGQTLTLQQQQKYEKIISSTEQRGKATAIKFLESEIKQPTTPKPKTSITYTVRAKTEPPKQEKRNVPRETKKKQSKTTAIGNLKRKRTQMTKAGFEINQVEKINGILLNPDNYTVAEIQQTTKTLTGTAGGREFTPEEYPKYDNYDAINVDKVSDIPVDFDGIMGVPLSFLDKHCIEQFDIMGQLNVGSYVDTTGWHHANGKKMLAIGDKIPYSRILIRKKAGA